MHSLDDKLYIRSDCGLKNLSRLKNTTLLCYVHNVRIQLGFIFMKTNMLAAMGTVCTGDKYIKHAT